MDEPAVDDAEQALLAKYGVVDDATGREGAEQAREYLLTVAESIVREGDVTRDHFLVSGIVARCLSLHDAALAAVNAENPHAAFTLLRAYAEQMAAVLYLTDQPERGQRLWDDLEGHGVPIGRITNHAQRSPRLAHFREVYDRLSKYAHPSSIAHFASIRVEESGRFTWQSAPRFKRDSEKLIAYAWCIEFAYISHKFLFEYAETRGLGRIVRGPRPGSGDADRLR